VLRNAPYVLNSTAHWKPLVNGYSGFLPRGYPAVADALRDFPGDRSQTELRRLAVTHVVVHLDAYGSRAAEVASALSATPWLELVASANQIRIYRLVTS
jgi:hypothetical protein